MTLLTGRLGRHRWGLALAGFLVAAAAGCAGNSDAGGQPVQPNPSNTPSASVRASYTPPASHKPSDGPATATGGPITVIGTVANGVEHNCIVLNADGIVYLLVGGDRTAMIEGRRVQVIGELSPGLITTCQQGIPLMVDSITPQ